MNTLHTGLCHENLPQDDAGVVGDEYIISDAVSLKKEITSMVWLQPNRNLFVS